MNSTSFTIYNASAGSGKTFTLVKNYLSILLSSNHADGFKNILAITFTNKAVGEMKERIIDNLAAFATKEDVATSNDMFKMLCNELHLSEQELIERSKKVLKKILHNYAFFDVSTIDKFNHRIIRTFAFDLKLPQNFEVTLDTDLLLKEAVDNLIANAGEDKELTNILVDFVLEKIDDDKSWDISRDILDTSKKITQENHYLPLKTLKDKSITDFKGLQKKVFSDIKTLEEQITSEAKNILQRITDNGIDYTDFTRQSLPNHFLKHSTLTYGTTSPYATKLEENIRTGSGLYPKKLDASKQADIDSLLPEIEQAFLNIKAHYYKWKFAKNVYKNLVPLTVINSVQNELQKIKDDENLVLISEFNATISETIKDQPAPFIYERLGEKFKHYFIDEFQDTSELQWQNLIPLMDNALSSETLTGKKGSLLLVGDAKQAIYRWRGGNPEQFVDLYDQKVNPFVSEVTNQNLDTNYRSYDEIINFNNAFFNFAKEGLLTSAHQNLYALGNQKTNAKKGGLVTVSFIEPEDEKTNAELYVAQTLQTINNVLAQGYTYKDIAILTRKNKQGVLVANALTEASIPMISSESLLLANNPKITFLNNLIKYGLFADSKDLKATLLLFLALKQNVESTHSFIATRLEKENEETFTDYNFSLEAFLQKPFYNAILYAIHKFDLADASDAYLQYYLDLIQDFTYNHKEGFTAFLNYWEERKDNLSLVAPDGINAVSILTIHRSKGLEFPVVIYPFAEDKLISDRNETWISVNPEDYNGFETILVNANKDFTEITEDTGIIKETLDSKSMLDNYNVTYVAFTRAVKQLHIISNNKSYDNTLSQLLKDFIQKEKQEVLPFNEIYGTPGFLPDKEQEEKLTQETISFGKETSKKQWNIVTKNGMLWDTKQQKAIEKGNIVHQILAWVKTIDDIDMAIYQAITEGIITKEDADDFKNLISSITEHPELKNYFITSNFSIFNEKELFTQEGKILRLDRLMLCESTSEAIIIDYKTGDYNDSYKNQLQKYAQALKQMNYKDIQKKLVYIYPKVDIQTL
ncbi:UvrD-helicase domain-containing protein [Neptunitalea lumnitzerae]|uniref:DNA 3'-5' helicase n=1 Tax=Neptunitalea lumnitzerae TaxID=2965509 RepID=A0ABQ5MFU6_9FLAO|nr:UvrD-helicase domain-containing protein [Neptunitalea sp. Y10]GLB48272.1 ATP-dependent helicase [Neptunitalea sp. Y10]